MKIATIDLFAGAGGLSIGAAAAGVDVRLLVELDPVAGQTLVQNPQHHGGLVITDDVRALHGEELRTRAGLTSSDPLLVIGGAPCQPFSKAAYWVDPGEDAKYRRARSQGQSATRPSAPPPVR